MSFFTHHKGLRDGASSESLPLFSSGGARFLLHFRGGLIRLAWRRTIRDWRRHAFRRAEPWKRLSALGCEPLAWSRWLRAWNRDGMGLPRWPLQGLVWQRKLNRLAC